jgi:hypothetical protein
MRSECIRRGVPAAKTINVHVASVQATMFSVHARWCDSDSPAQTRIGAEWDDVRRGSGW